MGVEIIQPKKGPGLMGSIQKIQSSPLVKATVGAFTGGLGGAVGGAMGIPGGGPNSETATGTMANNSGPAEMSASPKGVDTSLDENGLNPTDDNLSSEKFQPGLDSEGNAMSRRMDGGDPMSHIHGALEALNDPSIPQEVRDQYAPILLQAKHFGGPQGGL